MDATHLKRLLKPLESGTRIPLGAPRADNCLAGGLRQDGLHEVFAGGAGVEAAATCFALGLARRVLGKHKWLVWVRQDFSALEAGEMSPAGLLELGLDPARVLMVRAHDARDVLRAGADALANKGVGAAILEPWGEAKAFDLVASRRLTLLAQQHATTAIVLRFAADPLPSAAETRWSVTAAASNPNEEAGDETSEEDWGKPRLDAALTRNRHGNLGQWTMEWDCNDGLFAEAHPGARPAAPADRPVEAALEGLRAAG
jgi:protein ImuA